MNHKFRVLDVDIIGDRPVVVGTGPSGTMAAFALNALGQKPILIDSESYLDLEPDVEANFKSMNLKSYFGSYGTYYQHPSSNINYESDLIIRQNFTFGGFSRVWGGTLDFYHDVLDWPTELKPIEEDFEMVRKCLGLDFFANPNKRYKSEFRVQNERKFLLKEYEMCDSLLAISTHGKNACQERMSCITGCPNDSIWFAGNVINELIRINQLDYFPGYFLSKIEVSSEGSSTLVFVDVNGATFRATPNRSFLGLGPVGTANLMINSGLADSIAIPDNHTIFTGSIKLKKSSPPSGHSLSKWWLRKKSFPEVAVQLYEPNERNAERLVSLYPALANYPKIVTAIINRIYPMLIYMDSSISNSILVTRKDNEIWLKGENNWRKNLYVRKELFKLMFQLGKAGRFFPFFAGKLSRPGSGYHTGAFLKLGKEVNCLGQIAKSVHIIDSSVLPSLKPGSITPTIMLNCARIIRSCYTNRN